MPWLGGQQLGQEAVCQHPPPSDLVWHKSHAAIAMLVREDHVAVLYI